MENKVYKTKDLAEASFLLAKGKSLLVLERDGKTCWFVYPNQEECKELISAFWFGNALIQGRDFYQAIQMLKNKIFSNVE